MKLLVDTHFLVWMAHRPEVVQETERKLLAAAERSYVSTISLWEIRIKWLKHRGGPQADQLMTPADALIFLREARLEIVPLLSEHIAVNLLPPAPNRDPFDEMLLAQAAYLGARLLTRDTALLDHPIALSA